MWMKNEPIQAFFEFLGPLVQAFQVYMVYGIAESPNIYKTNFTK